MPFKSQAQRRKFYALKAEGKMSQETIDEWEKDTPKKLPERLVKKAYDSGLLAALEKVGLDPAWHSKAISTDQAGTYDSQYSYDYDDQEDEYSPVAQRRKRLRQKVLGGANGRRPEQNGIRGLGKGRRAGTERRVDSDRAELSEGPSAVD